MEAEVPQKLGNLLGEPLNCSASVPNVLKRMLRAVFEPKTDKVTGGWIKPYDKPYNLCSAPDIAKISKSRRKRWAGHTKRVWEIRNAKKILVLNPERRTSLERPRFKREYNFKK
jgi:hypothetical protein